MSNDSMLDVYIYENEQLLEKLELILLDCEKDQSFSPEQIADIFRILHTVKGSSAMMNFDSIANLSHAMEDLFDYLREHNIRKDDNQKIFNLGFETLDFIKDEMTKILSNGLPDGDSKEIIKRIKDFHEILINRKNDSVTERTDNDDAIFINESISKGSHCYKSIVRFQEDSKMEHIRALGVVKALENLCSHIITEPRELAEKNCDDIAANGFVLFMLTDESKDDLLSVIQKTLFIKNFEFEELDSNEEAKIFKTESAKTNNNQTSKRQEAKEHDKTAVKQNFMSVNLNKLDSLMDIVGEIVIAESTVTKNPEIQELQIESFDKAARQLRKLTDELQDIVMSIRMIPVSATFRKMERIVRDMSAKVNKKAKLTIIGEDTELDKNILDNLSDPLMHIIRNAMDHGLESEEERIKSQKEPVGEIVLEARNTGGDVMITVSDDGRGLNKDILVSKGIEKGLIKKPASEVSDKEAYSLIFASGFSTKKKVTEFSGRGVGMDVAMNNIEKMGGSVSVNSSPGSGMSVQIRIPLTLAIIDGMQVVVGDQTYIIPLLSIKESLKPSLQDIFTDTDGNENIYIRGNCYPIIRLHDLFNVDTQISELQDGILVIVESDTRTYCIFVDNLVGEQPIVVKPMPVYISKMLRHNKSIAGCTILGNGSISLIVEINGLVMDY